MRLAIVFVLLLEAVVIDISHAADAPGPFRDEVSKQQDIYNSAGQKVPEGYVIGRSLLSYAFTLSPEFRRSLANLGDHDRWLDIGAGEGNAVLDYRASKYDVLLEGAKEGAGKAQGVALSIEDRRTPRWHEAAATLGEKQIQYLFGRRLREYSPEELGRFQLMTDVLGAFSYTRYLSVFMEKALGILTVNGNFYTLLQDVHSETGTNRPFYPGSPFLTEIVKPDGSEMKVCSWLKSISCVEVTCELRSQSTPPSEVYRIRKVCDGVTVPQVELVHFAAGTPPERRFQMKSALPQTRLKAESLGELQSYLRSREADVDLFRARGPFGVAIQEDREVRLTTSERVMTDLFLSAPAQKAPLVIILHGHDSSKRAHANQAAHLASWGIHALTVELPNNGPWETNGRTLARLVSLVHRSPEAIDKRVDPAKIILVGHSFGAFSVAVALAEAAPAAGAILLDPAALNKYVATFLRRIQKPVLVLGADDEVSAARNRDYFYESIRSGVAEVSIRDAVHEDAQYPSEFAVQNAGVDPDTTEELQVTFVSALTAAAISLAGAGSFDYAWTSFQRALQDGQFFNAKKK